MTVVAIQAGGHSERMGSDKALLDDGRGPNLQRLAVLASDLGMSVAVVGRERPAQWSVPGVEFISDATPGLGPIGGLVTTLERYEAAICIACDAVAVEFETLLWFQKKACPNGFVVLRDGMREPLFAYYTRACLEHVRRCINAGERSLHGVITASGMSEIQPPKWMEAQLLTVNSPEEWQQFLAQRRSPH